jgi:hypothetical protein
MKIMIRPSASPEREIDVTQAVVAAVAHALWKDGGGNAVLNWVEAERHVARLLRGVPSNRAGREAGLAEVEGRGRGWARLDAVPARREVDLDAIPGR